MSRKVFLNRLPPSLTLPLHPMHSMSSFQALLSGADCKTYRRAVKTHCFSGDAAKNFPCLSDLSDHRCVRRNWMCSGGQDHDSYECAFIDYSVNNFRCFSAFLAMTKKVAVYPNLPSGSRICGGSEAGPSSNVSAIAVFSPFLWQNVGQKKSS